MRRFLIVIEKADGNYSAYSPDLPGCIATGGTVEELKKNMRESIEMHIKGLKEDTLNVPVVQSFAEYIYIEKMKSAFIIMPFDDDISKGVYDLCIKPVCEKHGIDIKRADEIFTVNPILDDIVAAIEKSAVIIADISGKSANVFYELGMSHILKRTQTIMVTRDDYIQVPFDVSHFRIIKYENTMSGKISFEGQLEKTLENILRDYKSIYREEFEMVSEVLVSANKLNELIVLLSLAKVPQPLRRYESLEVEGHSKEVPRGVVSMSISVELGFRTFMNLGYVSVAGDLVVLTDKGKAFTEILEEKGIVCDYVNGHVLTPGYIRFHESMGGDKGSTSDDKKA